MDILSALINRKLFGRLVAFRDLHPWRRWLVFLRAVYGLPMNAEDRETFRRFTGRTAPRLGGYPEAVAISGRQSGKSTVAALVTAYEASTSTQPGTYALLVAQDERAVKRTLFRYAREPFRLVPAFVRDLIRETADEVELSNGTHVGCYPCRPASVRGIRAVVACLDELAFFRSSENLPADREMLRAIRPTLATTGGKLLILSSPYGQSGVLWDLHRQHYGRDESETLIWQASAAQMNPTLPADYLARMELEDPEAYRSEVLGEFRAGIAALFDPESLDACVIPGRRELPPCAELNYVGFTDPSGGRADAFTLAIGHRANARIVVDVVRGWPSPFNPSGVVEEAANLLRRYHVTEVRGDKYAAEWPVEAFRAAGITYRMAERPKSDLYLECLAEVNSGAVELPDLPELLRELRGLERRRGSSGRDRVDHAPGGRDDMANAIAGLVSLLRGTVVAAGGGRDPDQEFVEAGIPMKGRWAHPWTGGWMRRPRWTEPN